MQINNAKRLAECEWWLAEIERLHGSRDAACTGFKRARALYVQIEDPDAEITRQRLRNLGCAPARAHLAATLTAARRPTNTCHACQPCSARLSASIASETASRGGSAAPMPETINTTVNRMWK